MPKQKRNLNPTDGAPSGGLSDILQTLYSEHHYLSTLLDTLEEQTGKLATGKIPDYPLLLDVIDYLKHYPDSYHHPREDLLFTTMVEQDKDFKPLIQRLQREHDTLKDYNHRLFTELTRVSTGSAVDRPALRRNLEHYVSAYRQHMDYESHEIFPRARGSLSAADLKRLSQKTRHIDDPLFGREAASRYGRLARGLQARMEITGQEILTTELSAIESTIGRVSEIVDTIKELKNTVVEHNRQSWDEGREAIREHAQPGDGPNAMLLPFALIRIRHRHWKAGIDEIRQILARDGGGGPAESRGDD